MELINNPYQLIPIHLKNNFFRLFKCFFSLFQKGRGKKLGTIKSILINLYDNFNPLFLFFVILSLPLVLIIRILKPIIHVRFGRILAWGIGQFALVPEVYLSRRKCGFDLDDTYDIFFLDGKPCNMQTYKMVKDKLRINNLVKPLYTANLLLPGWRNHLIQAPPYYPERDTDHSFAIVASQSSFDVDDNNRAISELENYGMTPSDKYVCLYIRDSGYRLTSAEDLYCHDVNNFSYIAERLVEEGYYVLRMGKGVSKKFQSKNNKIIDYAYNFHSDLMDIWLPAHCEFMVSTGGGLDVIPQIFRRPLLHVNCYDIFTFRSEAFNSIVIFCRLIRNGTPVLLSEMINDIGLHKITRMNLYEKEIDFTLEYNRQDEIIDTIDEFILRINSNWVEPNDERELNERFLNILKGWKSSDVIQVPFHAYHNEKMLCKVGYNYLKANQDWLLN